MRGASIVLMVGCLLFGGASVRADPAPAPPPVDEIVRRTVDVMEQKPTQLVCRVVSDRQILDGGGKVDDHERSEIEETRQGEKIRWQVTRKWKNGQDVTAQALAEQRRREDERKHREGGGGGSKSGGEDDLEQPFTRKWSSHYSFQYVRQEMLWGRPAYVLRVTAHDQKPSAGNGLVWIDVEKFVEMRGVFVPAKLPDHADWAKFQLQYTLHPTGVAVPSFLQFEGGGHFWFVKKGFRQTMRWHGCE